MDDHKQYKLRQLIRGKLLFGEEVLAFTTLKVGGGAAAWVEPVNALELGALLRFCRKELIPYYIVGNGSNLLIRDGGFRGLLIRLNAREFKSIKINGKQILCGAGVGLNELLQVLKENHLTGGEFLTGIPGTVGGALRMNAGAHGGCFADILDRVWVIDINGEIVEKRREELKFDYRFAPFFKDKVILSAALNFQPGDLNKIKTKIRELNHKRAEVTPPHYNAGCIFKNPNGISAGKLIVIEPRTFF